MPGGTESGEKSRQLSWKLIYLERCKGKVILCFSNVGCGFCRMLWAGIRTLFCSPS